MQTWTRAAWACRCGRCGEVIKTGEALLEIQIPKVKARLRRCEACEGPAPPDLPDHVEVGHARLDLTRLGLLPLEWPALTIREPGEEG
ncbi:MAG TPA: hypothetical protein VKB41_08555 [Steroidobacteraceae bacterium]|nr:hypothetical protein [Steroidobacteraceae bacterium]